MTQAEAVVPAGVQQEQLEAEERRRGVVLFLLGLAAILVFWPGVFHLVPGVAFLVSAAPVEGVAGGNVVLVGYNGSQKFLCGLRLARLCGRTWLFATWRTATCLWL
jgi:hypothetical protein